MSTHFSDLHNAATQNFLLDGKRYLDLQSIIGFTEYRVYCTKPYHGRINHAKFSNTNSSSLPLFNYTTEESYSVPPPNLCNALVYMEDDNSKTRYLSCNDLRTSQSLLKYRLYKDIWFVNTETYVNVINNSQMECDDDAYTSSGFTNYGTWMFYVR